MVNFKQLLFVGLLLISANVFAIKKSYKGTKCIEKSEFIYTAEDVSFPSCHASTIISTSDGLMAAWFGGKHEKNPDVGIWVSTYSKGEWSKPVEVANGIQHKGLRYPNWNPVLFNFGDEIQLYYKEGPNCSIWWGEVISTTDNGKTWSRPIRLPEEIWGPIKNKPFLLDNGDLLCPSSTELKGKWKVHMEISPDRGVSWERTGPINDGKKTAAIQPTILLHKDGRLQALCRSKNQMILSSWSDDNGRTWSELEKTVLPNPNSGIDAVTLKDGRHLLVYNHLDCGLGKSWGDRHKLNLAVSTDGINWEAVAFLEDDSDKDGEYSYPAVVQSGDGKVHITYTWNRKLIKHVVVDPSKMKGKKIVDGKWPEK